MLLYTKRGYFSIVCERHDSISITQEATVKSSNKNTTFFFDVNQDFNRDKV
jgi:hypothetical protein